MPLNPKSINSQISNFYKFQSLQNQIYKRPNHMDEFFTQGDYTQAQQPVAYTQHQDAQQNEWQQAQRTSNAFQSSPSYNTGGQLNYSSNIVTSIGSSSALEVDSEVTRKIAQEEERINEILRQKSAKEYEEKQARKATGREQLETFFAQKEKQHEQRKLQNIEQEKQLVSKAKELTSKAGWSKVYQNVNLKQGEHQGTKSTNRMRQSIVNKCQDQKREK